MANKITYSITIIIDNEDAIETFKEKIKKTFFFDFFIHSEPFFSHNPALIVSKLKSYSEGKKLQKKFLKKEAKLRKFITKLQNKYGSVYYALHTIDDRTEIKIIKSVNL